MHNDVLANPLHGRTIRRNLKGTDYLAVGQLSYPLILQFRQYLHVLQTGDGSETTDLIVISYIKSMTLRSADAFNMMEKQN